MELQIYFCLMEKKNSTTPQFASNLDLKWSLSHPQILLRIKRRRKKKGLRIVALVLGCNELSHGGRRL
jgi:hypothetical protein